MVHSSIVVGKCIRMIVGQLCSDISSYDTHCANPTVAVDDGMQVIGKVGDDDDEPSARVIL